MSGLCWKLPGGQPTHQFPVGNIKAKITFHSRAMVTSGKLVYRSRDLRVKENHGTTGCRGNRVIKSGSAKILVGILCV